MSTLDHGIKMTLRKKHDLRKHQREAIDDVFAGFATHDRGKLIMACGTGKTFTALKIAERHARHGLPVGHTNVLFLVPSISLAVTEPAGVVARGGGVAARLRGLLGHQGRQARAAMSEDIDVATRPRPARHHQPGPADPTSCPGESRPSRAMTVVFSTYQSIDTVAAAQRAGLARFDLIICDEAHRTTGVTLAGEDESPSSGSTTTATSRRARRLYMTATPRIYDDDTKAKAAEKPTPCSARWTTRHVYGPEFHRLGFGEAVEQGLLTDYKVLVLTVDESHVARTLQTAAGRRRRRAEPRRRREDRRLLERPGEALGTFADDSASRLARRRCAGPSRSPARSRLEADRRARSPTVDRRLRRRRRRACCAARSSTSTAPSTRSSATACSTG